MPSFSFVWRAVALWSVVTAAFAAPPLGSAAMEARSTTDNVPPNVLFIVMDQLRYDAIGVVQGRMPSRYGGKVRVRTPHIDRIATELGLTFETAYCQMPSCGPARATLKTGCTVARHGVTQNRAVNAHVYRLVPSFRQRIEVLVSFEQTLQQRKNYRVETYGKWHAPLKWYGGAVRFNYYSYRDELFHFAPEMGFRERYTDSLAYFNQSAHETLERTSPGQTFINGYSEFPYTPIRLDERKMMMAAEASNGNAADAAWAQTSNDEDEDAAATGDGLEAAPPNQFFHYSKKSMSLSQTEVKMSPATDKDTMHTAAPGGDDDSSSNGDSASTFADRGEKAKWSNDGTMGRDALAVNYTSTAIEGDMALRALDRLITEPTSDPFFLSVHFLSPHPPMVATAAYLNYYWSQRSNLYVPTSITDPLTYSAYRFSRSLAPGFTDPDKLVELVAVYYAMIEELDHYVGLLLSKLETAGLLNSTMIVITSDHGEMMGSHGMKGKGILYEEATRVPLIMANPGQFPLSSVGTVVQGPVSHLDLHATILDYTGAAQYDKGDGKSLRTLIEQTSYNKFYDERAVVVECDHRYPVSKNKLSGELGGLPNFMVRKGSFKLMLPRKAGSTVADMMFDLKSDPMEVVNLLRDPRSQKVMSRSAIIGKAEHLKVLLWEFMRRNNGAGEYYSSPRYQLGGRGDITEIAQRRTWEKVGYWQSDGRLFFGPPARVGSAYVRNEYWYVGRTLPGSLRLEGVSVTGPHAAYFSVGPVRKTVTANRHVRIKVSFRSAGLLDWASLNATMLVKNSATGTSRIPLVFE